MSDDSQDAALMKRKTVSQAHMEDAETVNLIAHSQAFELEHDAVDKHTAETSTSRHGWKDFPPQIKFIIGNEICERFSYYGMRSILPTFMISQLSMSQETAESSYHAFVAGCYFLPLFGGFLADKVLGKYRTILYLSLFYCLGHGTLALWESPAGLYGGLALIAVGSGGIKPCVSAFVGDQFTGGNQHLLQSVFDAFYWSINFGSFFSTLLIPWVLATAGSRTAFGIPGVLMGAATAIFWAGRRLYINVPVGTQDQQAGFAEILWYAIRNYRKRSPDQGFWDLSRQRFDPEAVAAVEAVVGIVRLFATVSVFWALFDQHGSTWVVQGQQMRQEVFGIPVQAAQMQALNPLLVMLLIPLFRLAGFPLLIRAGVKVTPLRKMSVGMLLAAASFCYVALLQAAVDAGPPGRVPIGWQFPGFLLITCSEILVSVTGLEFAYTQAPASMKGTIMSFWLLTTAVGNVLDALITKINIFSGPAFFLFFAILMAVVSLIFIRAAMNYKAKDFSEVSGRLAVEGTSREEA